MSPQIFIYFFLILPLMLMFHLLCWFWQIWSSPLHILNAPKKLNFFIRCIFIFHVWCSYFIYNIHCCMSRVYFFHVLNAPKNYFFFIPFLNFMFDIYVSYITFIFTCTKFNISCLPTLMFDVQSCIFCAQCFMYKRNIVYLWKICKVY